MWTPSFSILIGLLALEIGYLLAVGPWRRRFGRVTPVGPWRQAVFLLGVLMLGLALASPLDALVPYLLTAHMLQHLLLTVVAPPLLLLGTPDWLARPMLRWPGVARLGRALTRAGPAFAVGSITFMAWHIPALYDLGLRVEPVHVVEHLSFLATALLLWWPLVGPLPEWPRLSGALQMLYVFLQVFPGAIVGIILALAPAPLYAPYVEAPRVTGWSASADQQIAGLIMWIGTNLFWLAVLTSVFFAWHAREEAADAAERSAATGGGA